MRGDRLPQLGAVEHRQVRALAGRRHQVRGITEERHPGHALPSVSVRERVDRARDRCGLAVGDQRGELRRPPVELGRDPGRRGGGVGEVDAGDPLGRAVQLHVRVQDVPRLAVRDDPLSRGERVHRAAADRFGRRGVPLADVVQVGLDEGGADVLGRGAGQQRADLRPGAVGTDEEAGRRGRPVGEGQLVPPVAEGLDIGDLASPLDHLAGQGVEQDPAQVSAEHLGTPGRAVVRLVEQHLAVLVEHAGSLAALVDDRAELVGEAGRFERELPVVLVDVELAALRAGLRRRIRLVDRRGDAMDVEDACEGEAAEARTDDRYWCRHDVPFIN
jgi:hypothetical protein